MKKPTIQKYPNGGNFLNKTGQLLSNYGKTMGNIALAPLGIQPYNPEDFTGAGAADLQNVSQFGSAATRLAGKVAPMFLENGGTMNGSPNANLEKEELMQFPNGATSQVDGPSHAQGGVDVNIPNGTRIFSDKLKHPELKQTYAKMAEKYKVNREEKVLDDNKASNLAKSTANLNMKIKQGKLDEIFNMQESMKQSKLKSYADKLGIQMPQMQQAEQEQFANGGTKLPQYENGLNPAPLNFNNRYKGMDQFDLDGNPNEVQSQGYNPYQNQLNNFSVNQDNRFNNLNIPSSQDNQLAMNNADVDRILAKKSPLGAVTSESKPDYSNLLGQTANLIGPAFNLATNKKPKPFEYVIPQAKQYDPTQAINQVARNSAMLMKNVRANSAGNAASYLDTMSKINVGTGMAKADVVNKYDQMKTYSPFLSYF